MMKWHSIDTSELFQKLDTSFKGLTDAQAAKKLLQFGLNEIIVSGKKTPLLLLLSQVKEPMTILLIFAAIIAGFLGSLTDASVIITIVILNTIIGFVQAFRAEKAISSLKKLSAATCVVLRDDKIISVAATIVVPGDIVLLDAGNIVPADIRLIEASHLKVNESTLTGESTSVSKNNHHLNIINPAIHEHSNIVFKGTYVTNGRGRGVVIASGMQTELGKIAKLLEQPDTDTPLQRRLKIFGKKLAAIIIIICGIVFVIGYLNGKDFILMLLTALSLAVAAIPEALPAVITISLALGAKKLVKKNALIRKLTAVETLGSITYICTDKTGTLTLNKMVVEAVAGTDFLIHFGNIKEAIYKNNDYLLLMYGMALNNDLHIIDKKKVIGDSTEIAFYDYAIMNGFDKSNLIKQFPLIAEIPFDSERSCMTTIHQYENKYLVIVKGAIEVLSKKASTESVSENWEALFNTMLTKGLRVLGFAVKIVDSIPLHVNAKNIENDLRMIGMVGIIDPPREEVKQAIQECKEAGIHTIMITGDHPTTALTIAKRLGIIDSDDDTVVTGTSMQLMNEYELSEKIYKNYVYARVSPKQKLQIIQMLQKKGEFVAMTGDGVNDAPALKCADIGVAMGITGTDVAKEAAHMILLDDNFITIVNAIKEGRRIYDNIRKFIRYILTGNFAELLTILAAPFFGLPIPLLPIHILWINLVTDGLPGLALAIEPAELGIMRKPPRNPKENIFAKGLGFHILWVGFFLAVTTLSTQYVAIYFNITHWQTIVFTVLCWSQLVHVFAIRSESVSFFNRGIATNKSLFIAVSFTFLLHLMIIYLPLFNELFKTQPLSTNELLVCLGLSSIVFALVEIVKWINQNRKN
jgi:Ca2+-transporting ATPase